MTWKYILNWTADVQQGLANDLKPDKSMGKSLLMLCNQLLRDLLQLWQPRTPLSVRITVKFWPLPLECQQIVAFEWTGGKVGLWYNAPCTDSYHLNYSKPRISLDGSKHPILRLLWKNSIPCGRLGHWHPKVPFSLLCLIAGTWNPASNPATPKL